MDEQHTDEKNKDLTQKEQQEKDQDKKGVSEAPVEESVYGNSNSEEAASKSTASEDGVSEDTASGEDAADEVVPQQMQPAREIFVVLSQREDFNKECLEILEQYKIKPVFLNDNPDDIRAIDEIFYTHRRVEFGLIILAGDDFRYDRLTGKPGEALLSAKPYPVFLMGYLLAKFGNAGTMTIYREQKSFRFPVGQQHTAFVPYRKGGGWKEIFESKLKQRGII